MYWHEKAQEKTLLRGAEPRHQRQYEVKRLRGAVQDGLKQAWSPELIVGYLRREHPEDAAMQVSTETIYRWVYRDASRGGRLLTALRHGHKKRRRQCR